MHLHEKAHPHGRVFKLQGVGIGATVISGRLGEAVLVHDPIRLDSLGRLSLVEDQRLLHAEFLMVLMCRCCRRSHNHFVCASGLPVPWSSCSIGPCSIWVLPIPRAEEVPFFLTKSCFSWSKDNQKNTTPRLVSSIYINAWRVGIERSD